MNHHGVDYKARRDVGREHLLAMRRLWEDEEAGFHGDPRRLRPELVVAEAGAGAAAGAARWRRRPEAVPAHRRVRQGLDPDRRRPGCASRSPACATRRARPAATRPTSRSHRWPSSPTRASSTTTSPSAAPRSCSTCHRHRRRRCCRCSTATPSWWPPAARARRGGGAARTPRSLGGLLADRGLGAPASWWSAEGPGGGGRRPGPAGGRRGRRRGSVVAVVVGGGVGRWSADRCSAGWCVGVVVGRRVVGVVDGRRVVRRRRAPGGRRRVGHGHAGDGRRGGRRRPAWSSRRLLGGRRRPGHAPVDLVGVGQHDRPGQQEHQQGDHGRHQHPPGPTAAVVADETGRSSPGGNPSSPGHGSPAYEHSSTRSSTASRADAGSGASGISPSRAAGFMPSGPGLATASRSPRRGG